MDTVISNMNLIQQIGLVLLFCSGIVFWGMCSLFFWFKTGDLLEEELDVPMGAGFHAGLVIMLLVQGILLFIIGTLI